MPPYARAPFRWVSAVAIFAPAIGCAAPPAAGPPAVTPPRVPSDAPAAPVAWSTESAPVGPKIPLPPLLAEGYRALSRGDAEGAKAAFDAVFAAAKEAGNEPSAGFGEGPITLVAGEKTVGVTAGSSTLFFDVVTGEPFAFAPGLTLRKWGGALEEPYFAADPLTEGIYDARASSFIDLPGALVATAPLGRSAYLLDDDCRVREVTLSSGKSVRTLARHAKKSEGDTSVSQRLDPCSVQTFRDAAITADGRFLTTRIGRWSLTTGHFAPLPFRVRETDVEPAVSPDGRYVATLRPNPRSQNYGDTTNLVLFDLEKNKVTTAEGALGVISNGDPLSFGASPARVCVFDYGFVVFRVPSLDPFDESDPAWAPRPKPMSFGPDSCETRFRAPEVDHPEILERIAARICTIGGLPLPREVCFP